MVDVARVPVVQMYLACCTAWMPFGETCALFVSGAYSAYIAYACQKVLV